MNLLYLEKVAPLSRGDRELWIRYLSKYITSNECKISHSDYCILMDSSHLDPLQKGLLKEAVRKGSRVNGEVCALTEKLSPEEIRESASGSIVPPYIEKAFAMLGAKLKEKNIELSIICAGGFVLQTLGIRGTLDVDAFYHSSYEIDFVIKEVGDELGINGDEENWLNNSVSNMNKTPDKMYYSLYNTYSNLAVYAVLPKYLIGMKLSSGRSKDMRDVSMLIRKLNSEDPVSLHKELTQMGFAPDLSDVLSCFDGAYGTRWLTAYFKNNIKDIQKYM